MARGAIAPIPADNLAEFLSSVFEATEAAGAGAGWHRERLSIGSTAVHLEFVDRDLAELATRALLHLRSDAPATSSVRIRVWDSASTGVGLPPPLWPWHLARYESDGVVATYDRVGRRFTLCDADRGEAVSWLASSAHYPAWEEPAPFRDLLDRLLAPQGYTFLHGGSVGDEERVLLLAGPSGSGKSTTVAAAVAAGLATLGDDYVVLDPDQRRCHSLYLTTRLLPSSPAFPGGDAVRASHDDKAVVLLDHGELGPVRRTLELSAVVVPRVTGGTSTTVAPLGRFDALRALAPSSLVQLDPRQHSLAAMTALVKRLPTYDLALGSDLDGVVDAVRSLL